MSKKQSKGRTVNKLRLALPPPGLRKKLPAEKVWAICINMESNLAALRSGAADEEIAWDFIGGVLTWKKVADSCRHADALAVLKKLNDNVVLTLIAQWILGRPPSLNEAEINEVIEAMPWMEALAEDVDATTARAAATWSEFVIAKVQLQNRDERNANLANQRTADEAQPSKQMAA